MAMRYSPPAAGSDVEPTVSVGSDAPCSWAHSPTLGSSGSAEAFGPFSADCRSLGSPVAAPRTCSAGKSDSLGSSA
jgi:hypothetical protein